MLLHQVAQHSLNHTTEIGLQEDEGQILFFSSTCGNITLAECGFVMGNKVQCREHHGQWGAEALHLGGRGLTCKQAYEFKAKCSCS